MALLTLGASIYRKMRRLTDLPMEVWSSARLSFSSFGEDNALAMLLNPQKNGTYVDVGANDPIKGSNTALLYFSGWSGLTIDPNPMFAPRFRKLRPRDIHLTMGVAAKRTELTHFQFETDSINTFSEERAGQLISEGTRPVRQEKISCRPLYEIIREHLPGKHVDLLCVDCEGLDSEVLASAKLEKLRPTVLIVEDFMHYCSFRDGSSQGEFDGFLRSAGYSPIFQSAWSAIYVAQKWRELPRGAFHAPVSRSEYMP